MKQYSRQRKYRHLLINFSIENLNSYVTKIEEFLEEEIENFQKDFQNETHGWKQEDKDEYGETLSDEYWILSETHPNFLRSSMFTSSYSFFEKEIKDLSLSYKNKRTISNNPPGKKISGIAKSLYYLESSFGIKFSEEIEEWGRLNGVYREIRNSIVHDGGEIKDGKLEDYTLLTKIFPFKIDKSTSELLLEKEMCLLYLKDQANFFDRLFRMIDQSSTLE